MKGIVIKYAYKRYGKWYIGTYITKTRLILDKLTLKVIQPEIEKKEMVGVIILEANYE